MKKVFFYRNIAITAAAVLFLFSNTALAYWVWTPGTKKFINPKNAVKDTPKEQFEWAMTFYNARDFQRSSVEFEKLTRQYEYSEYASKAQYYVGLCYENMNKFYIAYQNYQKAIDNFPHIENLDEIVAREFNIANMFVVKESPRVLGTDILTSLDRAIEIYRKIVENAPYGRLADEAQFRMGLAMKKAERYDEAIQAFQKILDDYPASTFVDKAKFEVADSAYKASLKPAYDAEPTAKAIRAFEDFSRENRDRSLSKEAEKTIQRLKDKASEKSLLTAQFYEKQGRYRAAIIYYKDVISSYPESSFVEMSRSKIDYLTRKLESPGEPFSIKFAKPQKPKETAAEEPAKPKAQPVKLWNPFTKKAKTEKPKEAAAEEPVKPKARPVKLWNPFEKKAKIEKPKEAAAEEPAKPKAPPVKLWNPFAKKALSKESTAEKSDKTKVPAMKLWNPFAKKAKPQESAPVETPVVAETQATSETPAAAEAPAADSSEPVAEKAREEVIIPAQVSGEEPSQIRVTNDEEAKGPEPSQPDQSAVNEYNPEDEIERSEY